MVSFAFLLSSTPVLAQRTFGNERAITPDRLKAHLEFIASDEMEGRDTPSRGLDIATLYVATQVKLWGAIPAGDNGTFFQRIAIGNRSLSASESAIDFNGKFYSFGNGIKAATKGLNTTAKMVYVGHGFVFKKLGIDPYAGLDVKGKILVVASGLPTGATVADMRANLAMDFTTPGMAAKRLGAVGMITIPDQSYLSTWTAKSGVRMGAGPKLSEPGPEQSVANITAGPDLAKAIFQSETVTAEDVMKGNDAPEKGFYFGDQKLAGVNIVEHTEYTYARNVVAIVPGSDDRLKNEYVAYGAHIDHLGMFGSGSGDHIFNGADDDGSGTVSILEIAHAYLTGPKPKRSSLFVWHVGEEKGLWGSSYFVEHPTVNLANVITQLNIDMIGRSHLGDSKQANRFLTGPNEIYVVGSTKMSTDLQQVSESVNASFLNLRLNYKYNDPLDTERIFYRSDHYNYARKGIPIIFYFDGEHEDYHRVSDEVSKIDFEKMSRVAQTVYATGWALANADSRPLVDKPLRDGGKN